MAADILLTQQQQERRQQRSRYDLGAFGGGVDAVGLDCAGDVDQIFVDHGHEGWVVFGCEVTENLVKLLNVIMAVVGRKGDAGKQDLGVRVFKRGQHLVEVAAGLVGGKAAKTVVAAEFYDYDLGAQEKDGAEIGHGILGCGAAGALIDHFVVEAAAVQVSLQRVGIGLAGLEAVAGGDAVAVADQNRVVGGKERDRKYQQAD